MVFETLLTGLVIAATTEVAACQPDRLLRTEVPEAPVVVLGSLAELSDGDQARLPTLGTSDYARLVVRVQLRRVVRGDFPVAVGSDFLLGVHSVAITFGYDHVGETYYLGFEEQVGPEYGLTLAAVAVPAETLFFVHAKLTERSGTEPGEMPRVDLVTHPASVVTGVFEPGRLPPEVTANQPVLLGMPTLDPVIGASARVCLGLIHRGERAARPLRLVRVIRDVPEATQK